MERTVLYTLNLVTDVSFAYLKFTKYLFHSLVRERGKWKGRGELLDEYSCMCVSERMHSQIECHRSSLSGSGGWLCVYSGQCLRKEQS